MKLNIYSVYDEAVSAFLPPFFMVTDKSAERAFKLCARDSGHQFCQTPESFKLFKVGVFDDVSGGIVGCSASLITDAMTAKQIPVADLSMVQPVLLQE